MAVSFTKVGEIARSIFETMVWVIVVTICIILIYKDRVDRWVPIISALIGVLLPSPILSKEETNNEGGTDASMISSNLEEGNKHDKIVSTLPSRQKRRVHLRNQPKRLILAGIVFTFSVSWGLQGSFGLHSIFVTNSPIVESNILLHLNCTSFDVSEPNHQACSNTPSQDLFVLHMQNRQDELAEILVIPLNSTSIGGAGMSCLEISGDNWLIYDRLDKLISEMKLLPSYDRVIEPETFSGDLD